MIRDWKEKETMKMVKAGGRTHDCSVLVSEHVSKTITINSLYGMLSVIHYNFGKTNLKFSLIGDSLCSAKLYREVVESTV